MLKWKEGWHLFHLNQKSEMIKLSEEGILKLRWLKTRLFVHIFQVLNTKEAFLEKIIRATPVNTRIVRQQNLPIADTVKVLVVWIKDKSSQDSLQTNPSLEELPVFQFCEDQEKWSSCWKKVWR